MVEAQFPAEREFLPEHSLCRPASLGATTVIVPLRSPPKVRSSTQPSPDDAEMAGRGEADGAGLELLVGAGEAPQAATSKASPIAARRPADPGMCRRMLTVTRATDLAQAMHAIEKAFLIGVEGATEVLLIRHGDVYIEVTEPPERVVERMRAAVADAVAAHPGRRVVMIGHGVAILHYLCDVMRL